ncbi:MAG TPA: sulfatase [Ohtaekwangia sp.]|uniref:sulfatase family protein n=1 Tax=Ohtaekwangia sp. TaxID=2066019 RepID=UPI002F91E712
MTRIVFYIQRSIQCCILLSLLAGCQKQKTPEAVAIKTISNTKPRNVIFILSDDHRYDFMGFTGKVPGLKTPNLDKLASEGAHCVNAFVSTALCSPSRASILTGQYAHTHTIVDNQAPMPEGLVMFPQYLQRVGYQTAFFGKWHMGNQNDAPQKGFDHWVSFKGQGVYYNPVLNVNGKQVTYSDSTYITDLLTDHALDWLKKRDADKPFFLYLSNKAVHAEFMPAKRHKGIYKDQKIEYPPSMFLTVTDTSKSFALSKKQLPLEKSIKANLRDIPEWVRKQRYSWHGVDYMYHGQISFEDFYRQYLEVLLSVDENIGRILDYLKASGLDESTMIIYMGDNGFSFGEHGLIDKRHMYEESMRVPLLVRCPEIVEADTKINAMIQNIDIAPTILELAGVQKPEQMQGMSFMPLLQRKEVAWRDKVFYEYYWEDAFPQTPTIFGVRTNRYKYIFNHGVWDINELYDLQNDPWEVNNLIRDPAYDSLAESLRNEMWTWLEKTHGEHIPLKRILGKKNDHLYRGTY